ncbi:MAG: type I-C CRISPR-associated protein Cas8c/Csd1 [Desulfuromonadales bacterium]
MIKELSDFGKALRAGKADGAWVHNALKEELISMELIIMPDGTFHGIQHVDSKPTTAEAITAKKGKARLLLDKPEEVLCFGGAASAQKHQLFLEKVALYKSMDEVSSVTAFYENREAGIKAALAAFEALIATDDKKAKKYLSGNVGFRIHSESLRIHEKPTVLQMVINKYETAQQEHLTKSSKKCSVCGKREYPVDGKPHGMIKNVPDGQKAGSALVSYNENAFESYELSKNENSSICTNCARTYVEGLNALLSDGTPFKNEKNKDDLLYKYRWPRRRSASYGLDSAILFWTRNNVNVPEMDQLDAPDAGTVATMISAVSSGNRNDGKYIETEKFYSCTLSGAAARIAVRDWIETSLGEFRTSIAQWFKDIAITRFDFDQKKSTIHYSPLYALSKSCQRKLLDGNKYDDDDTTLARVASSLWKAAIHNNTSRSSPIPIWILSKVLQRAKMDKGGGKAKSLAQFSKHGVTPERAALIKLILNRNFTGGGFMVTEDGIQGEKPIAYICGEIFAKMESIQFAALGERNAGIREKFFSYAMTTPAAAFGRLFNLNSKHFTKLKHEKPGLAVNLDKGLQELCRGIDINKFPAMFRLEEQGQFAIGYYHQRQKQFAETNTK